VELVFKTAPIVQWTDASIDTYYPTRDLTYANILGKEQFIVSVTDDYSLKAGFMLSEAGGKTWTLLRADSGVFNTTAPWTDNPVTIVSTGLYGGGKYVHVSGATVAYSTDLLNWTHLDRGFEQGQTKIKTASMGAVAGYTAQTTQSTIGTVYGGEPGRERFVTIGSGNLLNYSDDGINWEVAETKPPFVHADGNPELKAIGGKFVAWTPFKYGHDPVKIAYSDDGNTWTSMTGDIPHMHSELFGEQSADFGDLIVGITYAKGKFVVSVMHSESAEGGYYEGAYYHSNRLNTNRLYFLDSLASWAPASKVEFYYHNIGGSLDIDYCGLAGSEKFIALSADGRTFYSDDGAVWKQCYVRDTTSLYRPDIIKYVNGKFFAQSGPKFNNDGNWLYGDAYTGNLAYTTAAELK